MYPHPGAVGPLTLRPLRGSLHPPQSRESVSAILTPALWPRSCSTSAGGPVCLADIAEGIPVRVHIQRHIAAGLYCTYSPYSSPESEDKDSPPYVCTSGNH